MAFDCNAGDDPEKDAGEFVPDPWDDDDQLTKGEDDGGVDPGPVPGQPS